MTDASIRPSDLDARFAAMTAMVASYPHDAWDQPSPCTDWRARDIVAHLIETERDFLTRQGIALADETTGDPADPAAQWSGHVGRVTSALTPQVFDRPFAGYFGPTTIGATMIDFYGFDLIVHRWDLARAAGRDTRFTDDELDAVDASIAQFGDAMHATGICAPALPVPGDADRQTALLATMGRAGIPIVNVTGCS